MLVHCPAVEPPPVPLSLISTVLVAGLEPCASATPAQSKMAVKDIRTDLYMLFPLFVSTVFNKFFTLRSALVFLMGLASMIRILSCCVATPSTGRLTDTLQFKKTPVPLYPF